MSITERKGRLRAEREARIIDSARAIAEREGWAAVTIRRLADEIEYSQPVVYSHFENKDAIVAAVALEGFGELAAALQQAAHRARGRPDALKSVALAYLDFALSRPSLYEAMFILPTTLRFGAAETPRQLRAGFEALVEVVAPVSADAEPATEIFWATLHGLAELERSGRIRPAARIERIDLVVRAMFDVRS